MAGEAGLTRSTTISGAGVNITGRKTLPINAPATFQQLIPANQSNVQLTKPDVTLANCKLMAVSANQDCVIKTNSTSSPQETLNLLKDVPLTWMEGDLAANKFLSGNVTDWYVTTGGSATLIKIIIGEDATPGVSE